MQPPNESPSPEDGGAPPLPDFSAAPLIRDLPREVLDAVKAGARRVELAAGDELFPEGDRIESLYVVLGGLLHATEAGGNAAPSLVRVIPPGSAVDPLQALAGSAGRVSVRAARASSVAEIPGDVVDRLVARFPEFCAARDRLHRRQLLCRLHAILGPLDEEFLDELETAVDWVHRRRGELLFEQGDPADGLFFVIGGRTAAGAARPRRRRARAGRGRPRRHRGRDGVLHRRPPRGPCPRRCATAWPWGSPTPSSRPWWPAAPACCAT
jgi:CRP-like cAMP-binding protein